MGASMNDTPGYAVFLFPQAIEALGDAVKPYLVTGSNGLHIVCSAIDSSGAFLQMTLEGRNAQGGVIALEMMIPHAMVRLILSLHGDHAFGFGSGNPP